MKLWRWDNGRLGGKYDKLLLAYSTVLPFDVYILRFHPFTYIPPHKDPVKEGCIHHRLNIILWGKFMFEWGNSEAFSRITSRRIVKFEPSETEHWGGTPKDQGCIMLSIGWLRRRK